MNPIFLYIPNLIGYLRIILTLLSLLILDSNPTLAMLSYGTGCLLDAVDGYCARLTYICANAIGLSLFLLILGSCYCLILRFEK